MGKSTKKSKQKAKESGVVYDPDPFLNRLKHQAVSGREKGAAFITAVAATEANAIDRILANARVLAEENQKTRLEIVRENRVAARASLGGAQ